MSATQTLPTPIIKSTGEDKKTDADYTTRAPQDSLAVLLMFQIAGTHCI